jgi:hypothetical protein
MINPPEDPQASQQGNLFQEVNKLRKGGPEIDQDEIDRQKLNDTIFGKLAGSKKFELLTLGFILVNAGFIGYDADYSAKHQKPDNLYDNDMPMQFIIMENVFAIYFTFEVVVRFLAFKNKCDAPVDPWFVFDGFLVLLMVLETWVIALLGGGGALSQLSILRLLRLLRITRMAKLMRFFPELQIIVKGMVAAVRSVVCTAILLILVLFVFSILFTSEYHQGNKADDDESLTQAEQLFGSMGKSMRHLFIMGTILDDITACTNSIRGSKNTIMLIFFIIFVLISSFTMLNMLIGILCEVVCATGEGERFKTTQEQAKEAISSLFKTVDRDSNGEISREEFMMMKRSEKVMNALKDLEIKAKHFEMYADLMFKPEEEGGPTPTFDFDKAFNMIMRLRPGTKVSALDFASFQMTVYKNHDALRKHIGQIEKMTTSLVGKELPPPPASIKASSVPDAPSKITASTLPTLERTPDQEILAELQRRLGMNAINYKGVPATTQQDNGNARAINDSVFSSPPKLVVDSRMAVEDVVQLPPEQEQTPITLADLQSFETKLPGGLDSEAWSKETYTC